ncbi:MAG: 3-hydroxyacyl-ACP dehydratase FabZ family protein [Phycisphaerae bacterium]
MPPQPLFDVNTLDQNDILATKEEIYQVNPHRYEFEQLDAILTINREQGVIAGYRNVDADEFWVRGHIPGRPIFPGVLMIETAAQLVSYYVMSEQPGNGFLGFGGVTDVKFRGSVTPGDRLIMLGKMIEMRKRRCVGATQGFVNGNLVYEGRITGMWI